MRRITASSFHRTSRCQLPLVAEMEHRAGGEKMRIGSELHRMVELWILGSVVEEGVGYSHAASVLFRQFCSWWLDSKYCDEAQWSPEIKCAYDRQSGFAIVCGGGEARNYDAWAAKDAICGTSDLTLQYGVELHVKDIKTGKVSWSHHDQLNLLVAIQAKALGCLRGTAAIVYVTPTDCWEEIWGWDEFDVALTLERAGAAIDAAHGEVLASPGKHCLWCDVKDCQYRLPRRRS